MDGAFHTITAIMDSIIQPIMDTITDITTHLITTPLTLQIIEVDEILTITELEYAEEQTMLLLEATLLTVALKILDE